MAGMGGKGRIVRIGRVVLAALLALGGVACLAYGAMSHEREVFVEQTVELPPELAPQGPNAPFWAPQPPPAETTRTVGIGLSEPAMVRDITVGGLERLGDGEIKRTYSGEAPALCPS
jgi:hypothetical protein